MLLGLAVLLALGWFLGYGVFPVASGWTHLLLILAGRRPGRAPPSRAAPRPVNAQRYAVPAAILLVLTACRGDDLSGPADPAGPMAASLEIVDEPATLLVADTVRLSLEAEDSSGTPITPSVIWTAGNTTVATVNAAGLVTGRAEGTTTIRATVGTLADSINLTVTEGMRFVLLTTGADHTCGLDFAGDVYCWGLNLGQQLGVETTTDQCFVGKPGRPQGIPCSPRPVRAAGTMIFTALSAGSGHTCGLDPEGRAHCWGDNGWEQLGLTWDVTSGSHEPVRVSASPVFERLEAGGDFSCGLIQDRSVQCWGSHAWGELGTGDLELFTSAVPVVVTGGHQFEQLVAGWAHACGLISSGAAYCWGLHDKGALGNGSVSAPGEWPALPTPTLVTGGHSFSLLAAGTGYTCGLTTAGMAYCWGWGNRGRLGSSSIADQVSPHPVAGGLTWRSLSAGWEHVCGFTMAGDLACWGNNNSGQLGVLTDETCADEVEGSLSCSTRPVVRPATPRKFKNVIAGGIYTCALDDLGYAFCWGANGGAQLGNGQVGGSSHVPSPVVRPLPQ